MVAVAVFLSVVLFPMFASFLKLRVSILFAHFSTASHSSTISKKFVLRRSYRCLRSKITPGLKKCFKLTCEMTYLSQSLILPHLQDPPQNKFAFSNPSTAKRLQHPAWIRGRRRGCSTTGHLSDSTLSQSVSSKHVSTLLGGPFERSRFEKLSRTRIGPSEQAVL